MIAVHRLVTFAALILFVVSGIYMKYLLPPTYREDLVVRLLFRSSHIYLLLSALANGLLALNPPAPVEGRARTQRVGSILIALTPAVFAASFFLESPVGDLSRPFVFVGVLLIALGVGIHVMARYGPRRHGSRP